MGASSAVVLDLADSWHRLAQAELVLNESAAAARNAMPIDALRHEVSNAFTILVDAVPEADGAMTVALARRSDAPVVVWPAPISSR